MVKLAEAKQIRGMWISFHPQLVGDDAPEIMTGLQHLIAALDFSVVSTTHEFPWTAKATFVLPMAGWAEETGTYTNFAGRVQITNRAVDPLGHAQPLHTMMSKLLAPTGTSVSSDPAAVFEWIAREVAGYAGMDYESIGPLGINATQEEVVK
jgi:predicted molibdopterin-dependent oxidoreductase YjgC